MNPGSCDWSVTAENPFRAVRRDPLPRMKTKFRALLLALALLQTTGHPGTIRLVARADGLPDAALEINARSNP